MTGLLVAAAAAYGVFLLFTAVAFRWRGIGLGPGTGPRGRAARDTAQAWLSHAGLSGVRASQVAAVTAVLFIIGAAFAFALFGGALPSVVAAAFAATFP